MDVTGVNATARRYQYHRYSTRNYTYFLASLLYDLESSFGVSYCALCREIVDVNVVYLLYKCGQLACV